MSDGRYTLTVQYDEPNPDFKPSTRFQDGYDYRGANQVNERINATVLAVTLTPEQFAALRYETLKVWQMQLVAPLVMDTNANAK